MNVHWITCAAGVATAVAAAAGCVFVRGSTAVPAAGWAVAAALAFTAEAAAVATGGLCEPAERSAVRLVVVALAVCPTMSLLGAKRPQHGVWQFIVATLACVLALPAVTAWLVRPGTVPDVHLIERCFLPLLMLVGWVNFAATRHALAAALVWVGQVLLVWPFLPGLGDGEPLAATTDAAAAVTIAAGALLAAVQSARWPARSAARGLAATIDAPVFAIRETLGAAWTLRIAERFNLVATERCWPCRLRFTGLAIEPGSAGGAWEREAIRCVRALLRRFVSPDWIARHGGLRAEP